MAHSVSPNLLLIKVLRRNTGAGRVAGIRPPWHPPFGTIWVPSWSPAPQISISTSGRFGPWWPHGGSLAVGGRAACAFRGARQGVMRRG